nr:MAG TPA: hypothetical protein [Caudoviricetes sp.]
MSTLLIKKFSFLQNKNPPTKSRGQFENIYRKTPSIPKL